MVNLLYNVLLMSISGTIMYMLSLLFCGRKQYAWLRYAMLTTAVILMVAPVQALWKLPKMVNITVPQRIFVSGGYETAAAEGCSAGGIISIAMILTGIWAAGAVVSFVSFVLKYRKSAAVLRRITSEDRDGRDLIIFNGVLNRLMVSNAIELRTSKYLKSPMLFGIIRPVVIIPSVGFSDRELEMILTHELVHYKHRDLWIALLSSAAKCVNWFNPVVYLIDNAIITVRELCCDETVLELISPRYKKEYGKLILSVIENGLNSRIAYTTSMASSKVSIQKRLLKIIEYKAHSRLFRLGCLMLVCSCCISSLTAFGFEKAAEILPEEIKQELEKNVTLTGGEGIVGGLIEDSVPPEETEEAAEHPIEMPEETAPREEEAEHDMTEPEFEVEPETVKENEEAVIYSFEVEDAVPDEPAEETDAPEPKTITLPESSYVFKPDFSESAAVRSDNFYVPEGVSVTIQEYASEDSDIYVEVYDAQTDELFIDVSSGGRRQFSFMQSGGGTYYIIAHCTTGDCDGIYVSGRTAYAR
ncbi:MAG: M56 family metallopeptidase [Candidatus Ornithomonoglobus sp.]